MSPMNSANEFVSPIWGILAAAASAIAPSQTAWELATGIPPNVVLMALTGTLLALRWTTIEGGRLLLLFGVLANTGFGASVAMLLPHVPGLGWTKAVPLPVIAFVASAILQFAIPLVLPVLKDEIPKRIRKFKLRRSP